MWGCGALYLASLAADPEGVRTPGLLSFFSPSIAEPLPVRGERGGAGLRIRALVDGPQRSVAARGSPAHPLQHDVGSRPRAAHGAALRPRSDRHRLHRVRDHRVPGEQPRRGLPAVPASLPRGSRLHRRRLGSDLRPHRRAPPLRAPRGQLHDRPAGEEPRPDHAALRLRHAGSRQLGPPRRARRRVADREGPRPPEARAGRPRARRPRLPPAVAAVGRLTRWSRA